MSFLLYCINTVNFVAKLATTGYIPEQSALCHPSSHEHRQVLESNVAQL